MNGRGELVGTSAPARAGAQTRLHHKSPPTRPLIVVLRLEDHNIFERTNSDLLRELAYRANVRTAKRVSEARRFLSSTVRPQAVIVADAAVVHTEYRDILLLLVDYVASGGTVVYAGIFSSFVKPTDLDFMFKDAWELPWHAGAYTRETVAINSFSNGLDVGPLLKKYSMKALFVDNVALKDAVYLEPQFARKLAQAKNNEERLRIAFKTPVAFATVGRGRVGYVGDVNSETGTTNLVIAMCFHPGAYAPLAPGTGSPLPGPTDTTPVPDTQAPHKRDVLILSLEKEDWLDDLYAPLHKALRNRSKTTEVLTARTALQALSRTPRPDAVLVSDAALTRQKFANVRDRLIEYARSGGIVILGMQFSNNLLLGKARAFFARWGVPWDAGSYHRTTFGLNPGGIPAPLSKDALQPSFSMKAVHIKDAPRESAVYLPTSESRVESHVFPRTPIAGERAEESPAVFARVGRGYLGYVGDVNGEQGSLRILLEMCGVKIQPGDLGPRTFSSGLSVNPDGTMDAIQETEQEIPLPAPKPGPRAPGEREAEVVVRAERRAKLRAERLKHADVLKDEGNELFRSDKWGQAAEKYRAAALLAGPQPMYLSNLTAVLLKLKLWELADSAATRALIHDPKLLKALFRRAQARKEMKRFIAAEDDIQQLLAIDKTHHLATAELREIRHGMKKAGSDAWPGDEQLGKRPRDAALEIEDESDSEDFAHLGNGTPCKFYNHGGCRHGAGCRFKHAPDSKSVRDELGRNVCVYWLLGHCRFDEGCVYAHDKTYLAVTGWWTDAVRLTRLRKEFSDAAKADPFALPAGSVESILAESLRPAPWRKDLWAVVESYAKEANMAEVRRRDEEGDEGDEGDWEDVDEWEERAENFGHTSADVEEMLMYGIKPWDFQTYDELLAEDGEE